MTDLARSPEGLEARVLVVTEHERWSHRRVSLVCGPSGSGKSTLAAELHPDWIVEVERFVDAPSIREKLRRYGLAAHRVGRGINADDAVVRAAAEAAEREHHEKLCRPARTIVLLTPLEVCHERIDRRGRPQAAREHDSAIEWWRLWNEEHR